MDACVHVLMCVCMFVRVYADDGMHGYRRRVYTRIECMAKWVNICDVRANVVQLLLQARTHAGVPVSSHAVPVCSRQ